MLLKLDQPSAGQQPWTEGGLELLQIIQGELLASKKSDNEYKRCNKPGCYFCYQMMAKPFKETPPLRHIRAVDYIGPTLRWSKDSIDIMMANINESYPYLARIFPRRSIPAIRFAKSFYAKQYGYRYEFNKWVK